MSVNLVLKMPGHVEKLLRLAHSETIYFNQFN